VVVKVTAAFGTAAPVLVFTTACKAAGWSGETEVTVAPVLLAMDTATEPAAVLAVVVLVPLPVLHDGRLPLRPGRSVQPSLLLPPPPHADNAAPSTTAATQAALADICDLFNMNPPDVIDPPGLTASPNF
jgi:hypothetical protein